MAYFRFSGSPPKEALDWFRAKGYQPGFSYKDVWREQHAHSFTVAKAMKMDVLTSIRESLDDALANGKTFAQWKKELQPELERLGWWGKQEMTDPVTGEVRKVQLGSPRRLKTIYSTNLRTARAAGQWQRIQRSKRAMPYLVYELGPSEKHRAEHKSWAGILLPADDPWWKTHYPPNGWGCKCRVRQVSKREYERLKASGDYLTTAPKITTKEWTNDRTGEVLQVPKGIDPGWDYNPGMHQGKALDDNLKRSEKTLLQATSKPLPKVALISNDLTLSTIRAADGERLSKALASVPDAAERLERVAEFVRVHQVKTLFLKQSEIEPGRRGDQLAPIVKNFLGANWQYSGRHAFLIKEDAEFTNGFSFMTGSHVVVKMESASDVSVFDGQIAATTIERAIDHHRRNKQDWSNRRAYDMVADKAHPGYVMTWAHEIGHQVHAKSGGLGAPMDYKQGITRYGSANIYEWHAEHFAAWLFNRKALAEWNPDIALYFDQLIEKAIRAKGAGYE